MTSWFATFLSSQSFSTSPVSCHLLETMTADLRSSRSRQENRSWHSSVRKLGTTPFTVYLLVYIAGTESLSGNLQLFSGYWIHVFFPLQTFLRAPSAWSLKASGHSQPYPVKTLVAFSLNSEIRWWFSHNLIQEYPPCFRQESNFKWL